MTAAWLLLLTLAAGGAKDPQFVQDLSTYKQLKAREATLQMLIRRAPRANREKYETEYEALKPKLYASAERAEASMRDFQRKFGLQAMCNSTPSALLPLVPQCPRNEVDEPGAPAEQPDQH